MRNIWPLMTRNGEFVAHICMFILQKVYNDEGKHRLHNANEMKCETQQEGSSSLSSL